MIDTHLHVVPPNLPGAGPLGEVLNAGAEAVAAALRREMTAAGVTSALAMGCLDGGPDDPLGIAGTLAVAGHARGLHAIGAMDPRRGDAEHFRAVERELARGRVKALKGYLGYLHYGPDHAGYRRYYELAERYRVPVVFHTGDTYSPRAKLRYAQPLLVDDVAVDHPRVSFVLAHLGNPWLTGAAEVIYKNVNVWADLSGLALGDEESFATAERRELRRGGGGGGAAGVPLRGAAEPLRVRQRLAVGTDRGVPGVGGGGDPGGASRAGVRGERAGAVPAGVSGFSSRWAGIGTPSRVV
jgi:predicted TIM-barrel fold metal-dependent hydrolase